MVDFSKLCIIHPECNGVPIHMPEPSETLTLLLLVILIVGVAAYQGYKNSSRHE